MKTSLPRLRLVPTVGSAVQVSLAQSDTLSLVSNRSLCHCDAFAPLPNPKLIFHALSPSAPSVPCFATHDQGRERAPQAGIKAVINPATSPLGNSRGRPQNTEPRRRPSHTSTTVLERQKERRKSQVGTSPRCSSRCSLTRRDAAWSRRSDRPKLPSRPSTPSKHQARRHLQREQKENGTRSTENSPAGTQAHAQLQARLLNLPQLQHAHLWDAMATPPV